MHPTTANNPYGLTILALDPWNVGNAGTPPVPPVAVGLVALLQGQVNTVCVVKTKVLTTVPTVVVEKMSPSVEFPPARTYENKAAKATNSDKNFISNTSER